MSKDFTVKTFTEAYNKYATENLKKDFVTKNLKIKNYVGFLEKSTVAKQIVKTTSYLNTDNVEDKKKIHIDSSARYMFFVLCVVNLWTNITVDFSNSVTDYDILAESNLIEGIFKLIPNREIDEFKMLLDNEVDDFYTNNLSTQSYVASQVERFSELITIFLEPAINRLIDGINALDKNKVKDVIQLIERKIKNFTK